MTGQGGWPMTVVMTPDGRAVLRRHLLPATSRGTGSPRSGRCCRHSRMPGARDATRWPRRRGRRASTCSAGDVDQPGADPIDATVLAAAVERPRRRVRRRARTGSGGRRSSRRRWCWSSCSATPPAPASDAAQQMADGTLEAMARGGIYDQLAGGFARYSVDREWVVPHFEKMLYDNAQLLGVYAALVAADRQPARRAGRAGDRRLPAGRAAHRRRAGSPPRWTPTPTASRARSTSGPPPSWRRCSDADDGQLGRATCWP